MTTRRRTTLTWLVSGFGAVLVCLAAPLTGSTAIDLHHVFSRSIPFADNLDAQIFFVARLPRVLAGAMVGSALAASGVVFQALLRNPLATPFTLGVSAGAALGAMLALTLNLPSGIAGFSAVPIASFAGSLGAVGIVYALARAKHKGISTNVLLLAGVTLNSFFSALILFVQFLADYTQTFRTVRWLMGDLDVSSYGPLLAALPPLALSFGAFAVLPKRMNLLSIGDDSAASRGVDVHRTQRLAFLSASLATGAAVSLGGPVGFIGIVIPHLVRLIVGADHRLVLPASAFGGAAFLVMCDTISRTVLSPLEVPVGVITAVIGGPFFLWLLIRSR
jgi:iron complex transport system permease protein